MKIVFMETPSPWLVKNNAHISLGLLYLATVLDNKGHDTRLIRPRTADDLGALGDVDIICMGGTSLEYPMTMECASWVREHLPDMGIFIGGPHATALPEAVLASGLFDSIGIGEGEKIIVDMVNDFKHRRLRQFYQAADFISDVDSIPFPNRRLIEGEYGEGLFAFNQHYIGNRSESIVTSRGCPSNCAFCASKSIWQCGIRYRSPRNVVDEIQQIISDTGVKEFGIWDDTLTVNKRRCIELCGMLADLSIAWKCLARAASLDTDLCKALAAAGCKEVGVGLESGDQRVLNFLDKKANLDEMATGCDNANKAGLKVRGLFMTGTPGEREDSPELTIQYINKLNLSIVSLSTFTPLPGSPIWNDPEKYNCEILSDDFTKYNEYCYVMEHGKKTRRRFEPIIHNKFLTPKQMMDNVERMRVYVEDANLCNQG